MSGALCLTTAHDPHGAGVRRLASTDAAAHHHGGPRAPPGSPSGHESTFDKVLFVSPSKGGTVMAQRLRAPTRALAAALALIALPVRPIAPQTAFPSDSVVRALLQERVASGAAVGIVVGLLDAHGTRRFVTYGSPGPNGLPLDAHSVFEIGSITKVFTATALADMVRAGEVSLMDPIGRLLPSDVSVPTRDGKSITLVDIATHRSGLPRLPSNMQPADQ